MIVAHNFDRHWRESVPFTRGAAALAGMAERLLES